MADAEADEFSGFVAASAPRLLWSARLLCGGDRCAAEDLVQDALVETYRRWSRIESVQARYAYTRRVMVRMATRRWRASKTEPVAVVLWRCAGGPYTGPGWEGVPEGGRLDLPTTNAEETWTFLGVLPDGQVALTREADDTLTYVRLEESGELTSMHELPDDAEVITPGGVTGR